MKVFTQFPYATSAQISIVDLEDIAQAAARVLTQDIHQCAVYELSGPQALSQVEVAEILSNYCGRNVSARAIDRLQWSANVQNVWNERLSTKHSINDV